MVSCVSCSSSLLAYLAYLAKVPNKPTKSNVSKMPLLLPKQLPTCPSFGSRNPGLLGIRSPATRAGSLVILAPAANCL